MSKKLDKKEEKKLDRVVKNKTFSYIKGKKVFIEKTPKANSESQKESK
ncbi:MAG: hypothetical protein KAR08_00835 [Candidatus Heimdallarchaeota archaeon]|nr:hypothetical protein [Candidatus Heimdallarchaeota archaeon]